MMNTVLKLGDSFTVKAGLFSVVMIVERISDGMAYCKSGCLRYVGKYRVEEILKALNDGSA